MTILGGPESFAPQMAKQESGQDQPTHKSNEQPDAGERARTNDVTEALVEQRAWEDSQRKEAAEAEELEHLQNLE